MSGVTLAAGRRRDELDGRAAEEAALRSSSIGGVG
jgi:hypothetical protein